MSAVQGLISRAVILTLAALVVAGCGSTAPAIYPDELQTVPLGTVRIDSEARSLVMTGYVNMVEGAVELLACGPGGKVHESVFMLFAEPSDVQAGMLLLGYKHGKPKAELGEGPPEGDAIRIHVVWEQDGVQRVEPAESFIWDNQKKRAVNPGRWIFNGSKMEKGKFMAGVEESLVGTYWDPWAIVNLESEVGRDDERVVVNKKTVPSLHHSVKVIFSPYSDK